MSTNFNTTGQDAWWSKAEFQTRLRQTVCRGYLAELANRLAREAITTLRDLGRRIDPATVEAEQVAREVFQAVQRVIRSAEAAKTLADDDHTPRAILARELHHGLMNELTSSDKAPSRHDITLICAAHSVFEWAEQRGVPHSVSKSAATLICQKLDQQGVSKIVGALYGWVCQAVEKSMAPGSDSRQFKRLRAQTERASLLSVPDPDSSRYTAETRLLASRDPQGHEAPHALNVLTTDGQRVCPVALRILYLLRYRGQAEVTRRNLIESLVRHKYKEAEIRSALTACLSLDRRLIFSGIDDHFRGVDEWLSEPARIVKLSSAGVGYLDKILRVPSYAQWALGGIKEVREATKDQDGRSVLSRLAIALVGFQRVVADELKRIEDAWTTYEDSKTLMLRCTELPVHSASADVFFKMLDPFMHVYRTNHFQLSVGTPTESSQYANEASRWTAAARKIRDDHRKLFEQPVPSWEIALANADKDLTSMRASTRRLTAQPRR